MLLLNSNGRPSQVITTKTVSLQPFTRSPPPRRLGLRLRLLVGGGPKTLGDAVDEVIACCIRDVTPKLPVSLLCSSEKRLCTYN